MSEHAAIRLAFNHKYNIRLGSTILNKASFLILSGGGGNLTFFVYSVFQEGTVI